MDARLSTLETLRRREHGRRLSVLRQRLPDALGGMECSDYLFGSLDRGECLDRPG